MGYNGGMEKIEKKIITNFENVKYDIYAKFGDLWELDGSFERHIEKRITLGHIDDMDDYIVKTLDCLANSDNFIFAEHKNSWDNICYNKSKSWAVIFNENGKIMTSYKIEIGSKSFFQAQIAIKAKIKKGITDEKFRRYFNRLRS